MSSGQIFDSSHSDNSSKVWQLVEIFSVKNFNKVDDLDISI